MFQTTEIIAKLYSLPLWLAQNTTNLDRGVNSAEDAALVFSGPKFFMALVAGLVLAFAFQLLFTNLSVAIGISALGNHSDSDSDSNRDSNRDSNSLGGTIRKIGTGLGVFTLVSVTLALLLACFLAVKLSLIRDWGLGAILGLVIWGAYFSLLVWVSSTTVGSLIGSVVNSATSGFQAIVGTATAALGAKAVNSQIVATAEAAATAVRRELGSAIDPDSIRETLEDYLEKLRPQEIDLKSIRGEFEKLLSDPELKAISPEQLSGIDRQKFVELVSSNTKLSKRDINKIVDQLETVWKQTVGQKMPQKDQLSDLLEYLKTANPAKIKEEFNSKFEQLLSALGGSQDSQKESGQKAPGALQLLTALGGTALGGSVLGGGSQDSQKGSGALQSVFSTMLGVVMGRGDLSNIDIEGILNQLQTAKEKVTQQADKVATQVGAKALLPYNTIRGDVENYLLNTYSWQMKPETVAQDFRNVIYDREADPAKVRQQVEQLKKSDLVQLLQQRGVFTQAKINEIADQLEAVRQQVLESVKQAEDNEKAQQLRLQVENYLRFTPKENLTPEGIDRDLKTWLYDEDTDYQTLQTRLSQFDRDMLVKMLQQRQDLDRSNYDAIVTSLLSTRDRTIVEAKAHEEEAKSQVEAMWLKVESYLKNTGKDELNPEAIKQELRFLLDSPLIGARLLGARASRFDRDTLVQLLTTRKDVNEDQVNQIIDQVQQMWHNAVHSPQKLADKTKDQYEKLTTTIADYLRNTGKEQLNPEGIQRDLNQLLQNPTSGVIAIRDRLAHLDRDTLVKLISQRQDLSEEQANQIINQVQQTIQSVVRAPRQLAVRTQSTVKDFQSTLQDYLRNTGKEELNPDAIKRDLQLLLRDPRTGMGSLTDRLSHIDRSTIVSLLSQRSDISEAEANRIVDQILGVREQFLEQIRGIERRIQGVIDGIFGKIRNYLNSLDRPELNYDGIKQDVRTLFDDPQAGFDALRDRLSHFNRDTLVAIMSSREDISEADANRIIDQIERTRNNVLQRAERLQQQAQGRLEEVKHQAEKQVEETRKAAASAAWWLFGTALTSAVASAVAGAIAVASSN